MRVGMQVSGSAIGRVFTQPVAPPRKFRGALDAAFTLAVGSVCAFALTLGPAPLNTVAVSSAAAAAFAGQADPASGPTLLPAEVGDSGDADDQQTKDELQPTPSPSDSSIGEPVAQSPIGSSTPASPPVAARKAENAPPQAQPSQPQPPQQQPQPPVAAPLAPPQGVTASAALAVVETFRIASGLGAFVSADACNRPSVHASVTVAANGLLPPGQAKKSLAPDRAHATVSTGPGALSVTVYACD